jgi:hypothetical protein
MGAEIAGAQRLFLPVATDQAARQHAIGGDADAEFAECG